MKPVSIVSYRTPFGSVLKGGLHLFYTSTMILEVFGSTKLPHIMFLKKKCCVTAFVFFLQQTLPQVTSHESAPVGVEDYKCENERLSIVLYCK